MSTEDTVIPDRPFGPYPTVVDHDDGRKILITQAHYMGKYLGNITVRYNSEGNVVSWEGSPIHMDYTVPIGKFGS